MSPQKPILVEEFIDWLTEFRPEARVATAQCLPYGQQLTYWPMRQILFTLAGVSEDAAPLELLHLRAEPSGEDVLVEAYLHEP